MKTTRASLCLSLLFLSLVSHSLSPTLLFLSLSLTLSLIVVGPGRLQQHRSNPLEASEPHQRMYISLRDYPGPLTIANALGLSEKTGFAQHWKRLTHPLGLSAAKVECIEADEPELSERCFKVLLHLVENQEKVATVAKLAEVVWMQCQDPAMLEILHSVCMSRVM